MLGNLPISNAVTFSKFTVNISKHCHSPVLKYFRHPRKLPRLCFLPLGNHLSSSCLYSWFVFLGYKTHILSSTTFPFSLSIVYMAFC